MGFRDAELVVLDCTLRDGGYYNAWDFPPCLINEYLRAMSAASVDVVELGFRFLKNQGFKGACAFTTDNFLRSLDIPAELTVGVMVNGADLCTDVGWLRAIENLFPEPSSSTPVNLVRIACHYGEIPNALSAANWLIDRGYRVGINLMQIADRKQEEIEELGRLASESAIEVLYFADSLGSMSPNDITKVIGWLRVNWAGHLGIHTHDNMGLALANTMRAADDGVTWLDATVTGMGRGPGNARLEELLVELEDTTRQEANIVPLLTLIYSRFEPMKLKYRWGSNIYYYLAGKYGIHPTFVQEMVTDVRYSDADTYAVIEYLRNEGGKKFSPKTLEGARQFYTGNSGGDWCPATVMEDRDVLILGTGPGVSVHRAQIETYIRQFKPYVLALNTQASIDNELVDLRVACHPIRLLADIDAHMQFPQPLVTPASMLPKKLRECLTNKTLLDFGLEINPNRFEFSATSCVIPKPLVMAYALALATSGKANHILLAGFDGYPAGDIRNDESAEILSIYEQKAGNGRVYSVTPTRYAMDRMSIYALV